MTRRSNTIKAAGLYTFLSELQAPEGSQVIAKNVNIDELGVITSRRGFNDYGASLPESTYRVKQILNYKNRILRYFNDTIEYDDGSGNFSAFSGNFNEVEDGFRLKAEEVNGNLYFTSSDGIKKISAGSASDFTTNPNYIIDAGAPKAIDLSAKTVPTTSGFLPPESKVAYKVLFGYKDANNVLILGSPTSRFVVTNNSKDVTVPEQFSITFLKNGLNKIKEVTKITCADAANTTETTDSNSSYLKLNTANDVTNYYVWFNKGTGVDPIGTVTPEDLSGFTGIEVDISGAVTDTEVAQALSDALSTIPTFNVSILENEVTIENDEAGDTTDATTFNNSPSSDIGTGWDIIIEDQGAEDFVYLGKYFTIDSLKNSYYIWYSESGGTTQKPQDEGTFGRQGIEIPIISATDTNADVAQKTANILFNELIDFFTVSVTANTVRFISKEKGNLTDATAGSLAEDIDVDTVIIQQGNVSEGINANCKITTIIPDGVTTDYFVQVYRTSVISVSEGLTINDIDPGEDCNLVYEEPVTKPAGSTITITDIQPNSFRDTGVPLYNNPISGEGILQANDIPPIAKDIETFNNFTFYSNTKTFHRTQFTFVSVNDFKDQETSIVIGNEDVTREYVFQGQQEVTTIVCDDVEKTLETKLSNEFNGSVNGVTGNVTIVADVEGPQEYPTLVGDGSTSLNGLLNDWNTLNPENTITLKTSNGNDIPDSLEEIVLKGARSYIELYSANEERNYYIWFDKGSGVAPLIDTATSIRVDLSAYGIVGTDNVGQYLQLALLEFTDFNITYDDDVNTITITNINNGNSTDADTPTSDPSVDIGTNWSITVTQKGRGEDSATNRALWSILPSPGQSIEETARSFVRIVNKDTLSPVRASYLSGENDLPGLVLLENKDLEDKPFYIGVKNVGTIGADIGAEFNPELPVIDEDVTRIASAPLDSSVTRISTSTEHGLSVGDNIYMYAPNNNPAINNQFTVVNILEDSGSGIFYFDINFTTLTEEDTEEELEKEAANGAFFFKATQSSDNEERPNRIYYSKLQQPEAVPITNFIDIGGKDEPIERILALRDTLFVLKTDGIFTITGFAAPFNVRLLDNTNNILAPDSAVVLNNQIFALMDDGVSVITESGSQVISRSLEDKILAVTGTDIDFRLKTFGVAYENDKAYIIWLPTSSGDETATQAFRYNYFERTWTEWTVAATCGRVSRKENTLYIGDGSREYLQKERKNRSRTDYADRNFTRSIPDNSITGTKIRLSSFTDVNIGDVLVQDQYVTIDVYNNLLSKLDIDPNVTSSDYESYESELKAVTGDNAASKLEALNLKLIGDGISVTSYTWLNEIESIKTNFNALIQELNGENSGTQFKTYVEVDQATTYESVIVDKNTIRPDFNEIEVLIEPRFFEGDIEVYKSINKIIQWSPLHFGDPSAQKQFSKGTIILDQNNFTKATVSYSSDLSQGFVDIEKNGKGVGYYSSGFYGDPDLYWGGNGNDVPLMNIIPREKQRGRYLNVKFQHNIAREGFRILGVSSVVRAVSDRAYR